jgi:hypothetical protein
MTYAEANYANARERGRFCHSARYEDVGKPKQTLIFSVCRSDLAVWKLIPVRPYTSETESTSTAKSRFKSRSKPVVVRTPACTPWAIADRFRSAPPMDGHALPLSINFGLLSNGI